ncbi:hypothetical protein CRENBAI_010686 [Crenichthys baileyi]|uniref:Uncharacterized protein n=1 Tax=Crenichthys baileyi TaxID=28760 RepID=A0AAV9RYH5_9TELE
MIIRADLLSSRRRHRWVNHRQNQFVEYHYLLQEQRLDDSRFQRYFHLSRTQSEDLLSRVGGQISLQDTNYRTAERLSICLR